MTINEITTGIKELAVNIELVTQEEVLNRFNQIQAMINSLSDKTPSEIVPTVEEVAPVPEVPVEEVTPSEEISSVVETEESVETPTV
jgi:hypothetical protein